MLGFLQEHGPYVMDDWETKFNKNEFSWNKEANMLYIESPAGVGYSFCDNIKLCASSDASSSIDNLEALLSFFEKFPMFLGNDLYLSGESYAGVYVPYLAIRIHEYNSWVKREITPSILL
jgi:carboxypeptidase C (cathepsin A)